MRSERVTVSAGRTSGHPVHRLQLIDPRTGELLPMWLLVAAPAHPVRSNGGAEIATAVLGWSSLGRDGEVPALNLGSRLVPFHASAWAELSRERDFAWIVRQVRDYLRQSQPEIWRGQGGEHHVPPEITAPRLLPDTTGYGWDCLDPQAILMHNDPRPY